MDGEKTAARWTVKSTCGYGGTASTSIHNIGKKNSPPKGSSVWVSDCFLCGVLLVRRTGRLAVVRSDFLALLFPHFRVLIEYLGLFIVLVFHATFSGPHRGLEGDHSCEATKISTLILQFKQGAHVFFFSRYNNGTFSDCIQNTTSRKVFPIF